MFPTNCGRKGESPCNFPRTPWNKLTFYVEQRRISSIETPIGIKLMLRLYDLLWNIVHHEGVIGSCGVCKGHEKDVSFWRLLIER